MSLRFMGGTLFYFGGPRNTEHLSLQKKPIEAHMKGFRGQVVPWVTYEMAEFRHSQFYIGFLKVNENIKHKNISNMT